MLFNTYSGTMHTKAGPVPYTSLMIYLADMHNNGLPDPSKWEGHEHWRLHVDCVLDAGEMSELANEETVNAIVNALPDELGEPLGKGTQHASGMIWSINGNVDEVVRLFRETYEHVFNEPPSGDDSVYDYWPGAVKMTRDFAASIDEHFGGTTYADELYAAYRQFVGDHGPVPEFYWNHRDQTFEDSMIDAEG